MCGTAGPAADIERPGFRHGVILLNRMNYNMLPVGNLKKFDVTLKRFKFCGVGALNEMEFGGPGSY
jgi:hypothetical protein